ncbi:hypothetical protein [Edaphobacter albus]|uniref:hypothetical protein n=1 Tax=Edaphobacter sp. 4G125 TaxID=2763071 RepID=UPI0016487574|nr:hypothetical protein [Edaphobacter sp. 4G125]QNI37328.1 hypothetical protein H7846_03150 [Edaphobacter sp. 4G125]
MEDLDRIVAVDWSGRIDAAGQRRHIWAGIWSAGKVSLEAGRTREELIEWLIAMSRETPRMVVSFDCCFSFPAWFLTEHGCVTVFEFWKKVAEGQGERWLARECKEIERDVRFWGAPHKRPEEFCGENLHRMLRLTDVDNKVTPKLMGEDPERAAKVKGITPKSPFQIGGSGSVGTGSLRAMPFLLRMWQSGFRVWPFESARLEGVKPQPLVVEMYTRLMTGAVAKSNETARKNYLAAKRKMDSLYSGLGRNVMQKAQTSEDAFDALVSVLEMARWSGEFARLKATKDDALRLEGITWRPRIR